MSLIIETGAGVRGANAYGPVAYVSAYLTSLGRNTAWDALTTSQANAAIVAGTAYIEKVFGPRFGGVRKVHFDPIQAEGLLVFGGAPNISSTILIGQTTYRFVNTLLQQNDVLIGGSAANARSNLRAAVNGDFEERGVSYHEETVPNHQAVMGSSGELVALADGQGGNYTPVSTTAPQITVTPFSGGADGGPQALSFPRAGLYANGAYVYGVPEAVRQAMAEYADRARTAQLLLDPTIDPSGMALAGTRQKVGPIETETRFQEGGALVNLIKPYPAADLLLEPYLIGGGGQGRVTR